jgi:hypothetical protein
MFNNQELLQLVALPVIVFGLSLAVIFRDRLPDRRYAGYALIALVIASNVLMIPLLPVDVMHKYTTAPLLGDEQEFHEVYFVDANGEEIQTPESLYLPKKSINYKAALLSGRPIVTKNQAGNLLNSAQRHRATIENQTFPSKLKSFFAPPSPVLSDSWTRQELRQHDEFVGVRVYQSTAHVSVPPVPREDRVTDRELIAEYMFKNHTSNPNSAGV